MTISAHVPTIPSAIAATPLHGNLHCISCTYPQTITELY